MVSLPQLLSSSGTRYISASVLTNKMRPMGMYKYLLPLLMLWSFTCSCSGSSQDPLSSFVDEASSFVHEAYPTYIGIIEKQRSELKPNILSVVEDEDPGLTSEIFNEVGSPRSSVKVVNVDDFGAKGDGTDDSEAFKEAWKEACSSKAAVFLVPEQKNYLLKPVTFLGPCESDLTLQISGTIEASNDRSDYEEDALQWLMFKGIEDFVVEGGGTIDGKGEIWWEHSCKINKSLPCTRAPTALIFYQCKNFRMMNLRIKDAQQMHLSFQKCMNLQVSNLMVTAPGRSPNTDGIHVTETQNIQIMSSVIRTGDDCISIVSGSQNVQVTDITCGPGHGISIGSLGQGKSEAHVSNVKVDTVRLIETTNGVRIKTWKGGSGNASNIVFQNVTVQNVSNPIIIDQNYCDQEKPCKDQKSAVQISNVVYRHIRGTSATKFAIKFNCSKNHPCDDILLEDVDLTSDEDADVEADVEALCMNVQLYERGIVSPTCQCKKRCMAVG